MYAQAIGVRLPAASRPAKVSHFQALQPFQKMTFAQLAGPGCIRCLNLVMQRREMQGRNLILRIFWDGEDVPSVEAPLTDFFGVCHGMLYYPINSAFFSVSGTYFQCNPSGEKATRACPALLSKP